MRAVVAQERTLWRHSLERAQQLVMETKVSRLCVQRESEEQEGGWA
jgi:hypothetical protein